MGNSSQSYRVMRGKCYLTQVNVTHFNSSQTDIYRFTYLRGMEDWVDLDFGVDFVPRWFTCLQKT